MTDLLACVLDRADAVPGAAALSLGSTRLTYGELAARIRSTAAGLRHAGMRRGDRVLFSVRPGPVGIVAALGIVEAGGTVVFADPGAGAALFTARMHLADPSWVAAESVLHLVSTPLLRPLARRRGLDLAPYAGLVPRGRHLRAGRWLPGTPVGSLSLERLALADLPDGGGSSSAAPGVAGRCREDGDGRDESGHRGANGGLEDAEALIVFTSGTTSAPKGVVHTRGSLGAGLNDFATRVGLRPGQRVVTDQLMVGIPALIAGAHWIMPPPGADPGAKPEAYLGLLPDAQVLFVVPAAAARILDSLDAHPELVPTHLETIVLGGAPVLAPLLQRLHGRFPEAAIRCVYGMTEILPVAIADGVTKLARLRTEAVRDGAAQTGTVQTGAVEDQGGDWVGELASSVTARLDRDELVLSGPGLASGYLADLPGSPLAELHTGDLARLDTNPDTGATELTLLGRRKDMFIRGTVNVYPGLYEPLITSLPGVAEAVMTGAADAYGDDRIAVVLVAQENPPSALTDKHPLAQRVRKALPGLIDAGVLPDAVLVTPELPTSGRSSKLDRRELSSQVGAWWKN